MYDRAIKILTEKLGFIPQRTVMVSNLHPQVTERMLSLYFKKFGLVTNCSICTYDKTIMTKRYAFVEYDDEPSAQDAAEDMNLNPIKGWEVPVIHMSQRPIATKLYKVTVDGIPDDIEALELKEKFEFFGKVATAYIARTYDGESTGKGYVEFYDRMSAVTAETLARDMFIWDTKLDVKFNETKPKPKESEINGGGSPLIISGFPSFWSSIDVKQFIHKELIAGRPYFHYYLWENVTILDHSIYTFFISYKYKKDAMDVMENYKNKVFPDGTKSKFKLDIKSLDMKEKFRSVRISHLKFDTTKEALIRAFSKYGPVEQVQIKDVPTIMYSRSDVRTAVIQFSDAETALKAYQGFENDWDISRLLKTKEKSEDPYITLYYEE